METKGKSIDILRKTLQPLLPLRNAPKQKCYTVFPSYHTKHIIKNGFDTLVDEICDEKLIVIDGYGGVLWENVKEQLSQHFIKKNKKVSWYNIDSCLKPAKEID